MADDPGPALVVGRHADGSLFVAFGDLLDGYRLRPRSWDDYGDDLARARGQFTTRDRLNRMRQHGGITVDEVEAVIDAANDRGYWSPFEYVDATIRPTDPARARLLADALHAYPGWADS